MYSELRMSRLEERVNVIQSMLSAAPSHDEADARAEKAEADLVEAVDRIGSICDAKDRLAIRCDSFRVAKEHAEARIAALEAELAEAKGLKDKRGADLFELDKALRVREMPI